MNRIVREHYPVADLPEDIKELVPGVEHVRLVIETDEAAQADDAMFGDILKPPARVRTLDELFAMRRPPHRTTEEIVDEIRRMRDEWDD